MRWAFGPPHLTIKPPQKTKQKKKKTRKTKNTKNRVFQLSAQFFGGSKFPFLTTWPNKRTPQNTLKMRFQQTNFWKTDFRHEARVFGPKNPKPEIPVIISRAFLPFEQQKNNKTCWTRHFPSVLANVKRTNQKFNLHRNLKNCALFSKTLF